MSTPTGPRLIAGATVGLLAGVLSYVAARAAGASSLVSAAVAVGLGGGPGWLLARRLPDPAGRPGRALQTLFALSSLLCVAQTARLAAFMLDPQLAAGSLLPGNSFLAHHSCFSAYHEAARLAKTGDKVYDLAGYLRRPDDPQPRPVWQEARDPRRTSGPFFLDPYEYPPTFLLLPALPLFSGSDLARARVPWFVFEAAASILALLLVAWHLAPESGWRFGLLAPLLFLAVPMQASLQIGNFQPVAISLCMVALVAIARGRQALGAAVLSFVVLTKLFPGVLLLALAARRRWRALAWTLGGLAAWTVLALLIFGRAPFVEFLHYQVPRIATGEAFGQVLFPAVAAVNQAIYGIPLKVRVFDRPASLALSAQLAWIYSIVPCAAAVLLGRKRDFPEPLLWALVLALATYRAPFLPQDYAALGPLWTLALLAVLRPPTTGRQIAAFTAAWILAQLYAPFALVPPAAALAVNTVAQLVAAAILVAAARVRIRTS